MSRKTVALIAEKIRESRSIVVTSHLRPDGDSLCTSLSLYFMGRLLGKDMAIINKDKTPFPFDRYPDIDKIQIGQIPPGTFDLIILLECANIDRSGHPGIEKDFKVNMDHHYSNDHYAEINWVEPEASAVAEMAFRLGKKLEIPFTPRIAGHLYCGIASDTGSFQFSNTSAEAFKSCHELVNLGADPVRVSEFLFNNNSPEKVKLMGRVLSTLQMHETGEIAMITMFREFMEDLNLREVETEDITTTARSIEGVKVVLFFKEVDSGEFRVSIRSKGKANAARIAEHFGGGGHQHAAGFTVYGDHSRLIKDIPDKVSLLMHKHFHPDAPEKPESA